MKSNEEEFKNSLIAGKKTKVIKSVITMAVVNNCQPEAISIYTSMTPNWWTTKSC